MQSTAPIISGETLRYRIVPDFKNDRWLLQQRSVMTDRWVIAASFDAAGLLEMVAIFGSIAPEALAQLEATARGE